MDIIISSYFFLLFFISYRWYGTFSPRFPPFATLSKDHFNVEKGDVMKNTNLSGGELGDGLGALGDGVLGELTGKDEADRGLDFPGGKGRLTVVLGELSGLSGNALEGVVDEGVHDGHSLRSESAIEEAKRTDLD